MKKLHSLAIILAGVLCFANAFADWKMPPTAKSKINGGTLNDEEMKQCVVLYNYLVQLKEQIKNTQVNPYSEQSIDSYNNQVDKFHSLAKKYNTHCSKKQSKINCKTRNELNRMYGQSEINCR